MAVVNAHLAHLRPWYEEHCHPIVDELYREEHDAAVRALGQARLALAQSAHNPDERRALEYELFLFDFLIPNRFLDDEQQAPYFEATYSSLLARPPVGPLSDSVQAVNLLSMLGMGARRGFIAMDEQDVDTLVTRIPEEHLTSNIWYYIVAWAYHARDLKYIELAYQRQMTEATGWVDDYYWLRTNLMYLIVAGRVTRLDVEKTLEGYDHPHHIVDFEKLFLPRLEEAGLMDEGLYALYEGKRAQLQPLTGTVPQMKARTRRARTNT